MLRGWEASLLPRLAELKISQGAGLLYNTRTCVVRVHNHTLSSINVQNPFATPKYRRLIRKSLCQTTTHCGSTMSRAEANFYEICHWCNFKTRPRAIWEECLRCDRKQLAGEVTRRKMEVANAQSPPAFVQPPARIQPPVNVGTARYCSSGVAATHNSTTSNSSTTT